MDKLDYGTSLSPSPIALNIGTIRKPTLKEIADISFEQFNFLEALSTLTPELFYEKMNGDEGKQYWDSLPDDKRQTLTVWDIAAENPHLGESFNLLFNFFFVEPVVYKEGFYFILNNSDSEKVSKESIRGVITKDIFSDVLKLIRQICCIQEEKTEEKAEVKFKNALAEKLYKKMQGADKGKEKRNVNVDLTLANIISSVSNKHPAITPVTVWDLTIFQLMDSFNRLQANAVYDIDANRVSVWGDEKNTFSVGLWYKNNFDK